ncbi:helix-turn-helix transcriptional regulator [Hypericibacter adhaerens]|jgi:predicted ArsR family transcriptional regulator|nr:metalloregulator ArsR/SmtB family transcription factor [Hypericibacter adhaerens]
MAASDRDILELLKTRGPISTVDVAATLDVTPQGARQRLESLRAAGLVETGEAKGAIGRPGLSWFLSEAGHAQFPDGHDRFAVELIDIIRGKLGAKALDRLIAAREAEQRRRYQAALAPAGDLRAKLQRLAQERTREGYMAEIRATDDGGWLLIEHHCPICAAATACRGFCRSELQLFRAVLGPGVRIERAQHLISGEGLAAGERRCAYRIEPPAPSAAARPVRRKRSRKPRSRL